MLGKTYCCCVNGLDAHIVTIEVRISRGIKYYMVGLAEQSVKESLHRVESALQSIGFKMPRQKLVINLIPSDIRKSGVHYDVAIAVAILVVSGQIKDVDCTNSMFIGGLSLDGEIQATKGLLTMAIEAKRKGIRRVIVPYGQIQEARLVPELEVVGVRNLSDVLQLLANGIVPEPTPVLGYNRNDMQSSFADSEMADFRGLKGQKQARRALEIAASGGHNVLMIGPPGSGKTLLSKMFLGILPPLNLDEAMETWQLYSLAGYTPPGGEFSSERPFRAPHHTIGYAALVGGGVSPTPGEITLAHKGVLFMDELPEFKRAVLEALRQPLESRQILISRARNKISFPADFVFVGAMNPCPCGFHNHPQRACSCSLYTIQRYLSKISGPLLDRIDIHLEVPPVLPGEMTLSEENESSEGMLQRVSGCREIQRERFKDGVPLVTLNGQMSNRMLSKYCPLSKAASELLSNATEKLFLSARSHERILKVARTIADVEQHDTIQAEHVAEALMYRCLDRKNWIEKN